MMNYMKNAVPRQKLGRTDLLVSKIGLGTVELGYTYGIGPRTMPSEIEAIQLLRETVEMGITFFDTAHFYGSAEERIGKSEIAKMNGVVVATKCGHILDKGARVTREVLEKQIREEVEESRKKLDLDILPLVMLHGGSKEQIGSGDLIEIMQKLKGEKKIRYTGITTRGEEAPRAAIQSDFFDVIQVGYSILDQRIDAHVLPEAKKNNIGVIARSILLKGALTPAVSHLPQELQKLKEGSARAAAIAEQIGTTLPDLAIRFVLANNDIAVALLGTNRIAHIRNAIEAATKEPLPADIINELKNLAIDDESLVDPARWPPSSVSDQKGGEKIVPHSYKKE